MTGGKNQNNPILVILCALGLIGFLLLVIYPNHRALKGCDRQIAALNGEIALRQALAPTYGKLVEQTRRVPSTSLALPSETVLDIQDTGDLTRIFQDVAVAAGLTLVSIRPDAQTADRRQGRLRVEVSFRGDFLNFQPLLKTILGRSFVDRIESIQVQGASVNQRITLSVVLYHR